MVNSKLKWVVLSFSVAGLGIAMPSCPGQEAMQQQLNAVQTSNLELSKKVQTMNSQVSTLNNEMSQIKQLMSQITSVIQAQKGALDQLDSAVKGMKGIKGGKKKR